MRTLFLCALLMGIMFSCRKDLKLASSPATPLPDKEKQYLRTNMVDTDFVNLNFTDAAIVYNNNETFRLWSIPLTSRFPSSDFVLMEVDINDNCISARIFSVVRNMGVSDQFNGTIKINTLARQKIFASDISNGYVTELHKLRKPAIITDNRNRVTVIPADNGGEELQEIIVVGYINSESGGVSLQTYMMFMTMMAVNPDGASGGSGGGSSSAGSNASAPSNPSTLSKASNIYSPLSPVSPAGGSALPTITMDIEEGVYDPPISLPAYIKAFSTIPDNNNTTYSVTILTDIPVDSDPNVLFSYSNGSPGHTFLQLTKQNGTQSITQNIGFYPNGSFKDLLNCSPVQSKFVDNQFHEYNASLKMNVSATSFQAALKTLLSNSGTQYDIDQFNCTDMALQVFNASRVGTPLTIPLYHIPGSPINSSNTPQGLYFELNNMKQSYSPESANIVAVGKKLYVGASHGPF